MNLFIWDFHGVLEQDNEKAVIEISNVILAKNGYSERFSDDDIDRLYGRKWYQYFEYLLPDQPESEWMKLQSGCLENQAENYEIIESIIQPTTHALEVLDKIKNSGNDQILISNTRPDDIIWFLESVGEKKFFDDDQIFGVNSHQTHSSKIDAIKQYLTDKKFDKIICIGDSEGDLELGRAVNAINYFYRHPGRKHTDTKNADYVIDDLREILKEL